MGAHHTMGISEVMRSVAVLVAVVALAALFGCASAQEKRTPSWVELQKMSAQLPPETRAKLECVKRCENNAVDSACSMRCISKPCFEAVYGDGAQESDFTAAEVDPN